MLNYKTEGYYVKKRRTALVLILCLVMASLAGCGKSAAQDDIKVEGPKSEEEKMKNMIRK